MMTAAAIFTSASDSRSRKPFPNGDIEALNLGALFGGCLPMFVACLQIVPKTDVGSERIR